MNKSRMNNILVFILIVFFEPQIFKENAFKGVTYVDQVYKILKILAFFIVLLIYTYKKTKYSKIVLSVFVLQLITFISTLINKGSVMRFIGPAITTVTMVMIAEILISRKIIVEVLKKVNIYFVICFILNLISIIMIDIFKLTNFTKIYFLGIDNRFIFTLLPWIVSEGIVSIIENKKLSKRWLWCVVASELVLLYKFSVAAMIAVVLFVLLYFINNKISLAKYSKIVLYGYVILNILIVFFNIQNYFTPILNIVDKDVTFSGRTFLWDGVKDEFLKNPILGNGMQSEEYDKSFFYKSTAPYYLDFAKVVHAHNSAMAIIYRGGGLAILVYLYILYYCTDKIKKNYKNPLANLFIVSIAIIFMLSIFDTMDFAGLYFIITLAINMKKIIGENNVKEVKYINDKYTEEL